MQEVRKIEVRLNQRTARLRTDLGQEPASKSAVESAGGLLALRSIVLAGGTANPSWPWQIPGDKILTEGE